MENTDLLVVGQVSILYLESGTYLQNQIYEWNSSYFFLD